jgi:hypothetical protein
MKLNERKITSADIMGELLLNTDDYTNVMKFARDIVEFLYGKSTPFNYSELMVL